MQQREKQYKQTLSRNFIVKGKEGVFLEGEVESRRFLFGFVFLKMKCIQLGIIQ